MSGAGGAKTEYDIVEYPYSSFSQCSPDRLGVAGVMLGMNPAPGDRCRVLELGCGSGGTLISLAALFPESSYWGVDLSQVAIDAGQRRIATLGLANVKLDPMDVMDFPADAGEFDYIVLHGLFSWVPDFVREKILAICQKHLAPHGIAYISYNAFPGCRIRQMWREMMLFHTAQFDDPKDKIAQGRDMMQLVAHGTTRDDPPHVLAKAEYEQKRKAPDSTLFHDDLAGVWQPFYFREFVGLASRYGLQYLSEAAFTDTVMRGLTPAAERVMEQVREHAGELVYEQYMDMLKIRRFRQTLLCREGIELPRPENPMSMARLHFSGALEEKAVEDAAAPPDSRAFGNAFNEVVVTTNNAVSNAAFECLAKAWPRTVSFEEIRAAVGEVDEKTLCMTLHGFFAAGLIEAHNCARRLGTSNPGPKPEAWVLARADAALQDRATHLHNGRLELKDDVVRTLLQMMDGTRTREELSKMVPAGYEPLDETLRKFTRAGVMVG